MEIDPTSSVAGGAGGLGLLGGGGTGTMEGMTEEM